MKWTGERVMVLCVLSHSHASASMSIYRSSDPDSVAQVRHTKLFGRSMSMKLLFCLFDCFLPTERFKLSRCHHLSDRNALFKKKKERPSPPEKHFCPGHLGGLCLLTGLLADRGRLESQAERPVGGRRGCPAAMPGAPHS